MDLRQIEEMAKLRDAIFNDIKKMDKSGKNNDFYDFRRYPRIISFEEFCDIMGKEYSEDKMSEITGIPKELLYGPKQNKTENEESDDEDDCHEGNCDNCTCDNKDKCVACCCRGNNDKHTSDNHIGVTLPSIIEESLLEYRKNIEAKRKAEIDEATEEIKKFTKWLEELSVKDGEYNPSVILEHSLEYFKQKKISTGTYYMQKLREIDSVLNKYNFE